MKNFIKLLLPRHFVNVYTNVRTQLRVFRILAFNYGQYGTIKSKTPIDENNQALPWYSYPAIEFLKRLDFSEKCVYEYGSGNSSKWWAKRAKFVISVEDNQTWYEKVFASKLENQKIFWFEKMNDYTTAIQQHGTKFDVIVIDGNHRYECALTAVEYLSENGVIILDNSDWHPKTAEYLRRQSLIQIDFAGFGPINGYAWVTSVFLTRNYNFEPILDNQPGHCIGGLKQYAEK